MEDKYLKECQSHYQAWTKDVEQRLTRKNGWNDITDAYYGKLPDDWPFTSKTTDPRIKTALLEKNARLTNGKLRGRLVPRETGDIISARIQNALLDFQWDKAQEGGSMQVKISICDMDTRLYQSKFALCDWKTKFDDQEKIIFEGNEMEPLDIRDCGMDFNASHIKDAKWFQYRNWEYVEDLEKVTDASGKPVFKNLGNIKSLMLKDKENAHSDTKNDYTSHVKELRGLEDRVGTDIAFPVLEVVTERRDDKWITFSPKYNELLRVIDNPYKSKTKRVAQLRYYPLQDDPLGESEVESVIPLWKAIQATICSYMDEVVLKMRPPLKILEGQARLETIVYNPEAQWLMDRPDAVTEMQSNGQAIQYFQSTYSALISAFNSAMGMLSQGTSNVDPNNPGKTATEIDAVMSQQNARDEKNQSDLAEFIKDIMMFWVDNNKQFIFSDPSKNEYLVRIIGQENFSYFKQAGLDQMELTPQVALMIKDIIDQNPDTTESDLQQMIEAGKTPKYPVVVNPREKNPSKIELKPKMKINDTGDVAEISAVSDDFEGTYDYIADVRSMRMGADQELVRGRQNMIGTLVTGASSQNVLQLLAQEGFRPKVKELLSQSFEDLGMKDADRFFEKLEPAIPNGNQIGQTAGQATGPTGQPTVSPTQTGLGQMGGVQPPVENGGLPQLPQTPA